MNKFYTNKLKTIRLFIIILFFSLPKLSVNAQNGLDALKHLSQDKIDYYTTNEGLTNNAVLDVEKSTDGYMCFATFYRLTRLGGISLKVFNKFNNDIITSNSFITISKSKRKGMWIGTNGGLNKFKQAERISDNAVNDEGTWSEKEAELEIIKTPYFYEKYWVNIFFVILIVGIIYFVVRQRSNRLNKLNEKLHQLVEKNKSLDTTVKKLEVSNKDLKKFAYIASHDLKSPLRGISMIAEFIIVDNQDKLDENGKSQLVILKSRVKRMGQLIDGILAYSIAGNASANRKKIDLNQIIASTLELILPPDHIKIKIVNKLPIIVEDETTMQQLFQNLLTNAIKFNDKPNGEIKIGYSDKDTHYEFYVSDNGLGIEDKYFDEIFHIFHTLQEKGEKENTGIGLSIVKKIIEMLKGEIRVESELTKGATFIFSWPKNNVPILSK